MNEAGGNFFLPRDSGFLKIPVRKYLLPLILILCLNCSGLLLRCQDTRELLKTAKDYFNKEQYHSAAQYYQVAVGMEADNAESNYNLAQSYRATFNYTLAEVYFQKTIALDVITYPLAPYYLALMQKSLGKFKLAFDGFEQFIESNKNSPLLPLEVRESYLAQATLEKEGCLLAIEQVGRSWMEMGFMNLGEPANTPFNDYAAVVAGNDSTITLTSGRRGVKGGLLDNRFGDYFTDNFRFEKTGDTWSMVNNSDRFDRTNTKFSDGVGIYNSLGDKFYFTSCYEDNAYCKLYMTEMVNGQWKNPKLLNENINTGEYDNRHPALTPGGDTLIFVSNRPGGVGGNDLWYSVSQGDDNWGAPEPLPGDINTPFNEISPFYHKDNVLFFSSDGHVGLGGMDILMVENFGSEEMVVKNLGIPFNSGFDDSFFTVGRETGYLSSNRAGGFGKFDIYKFDMPVQAGDLARFLEESADGEQLRSRLRSYDQSNLFSARDEDQFYYDNLTAEERAAIDRILSLKQQSTGAFDPRTLTPGDFRYYKKLDIATKATIERLAQRQALGLPGISESNSLTAMERSDWQFYQSIDPQEKAIIDRIIDAKIVAQQKLLAQLSPEEQIYWSGSRITRDRIETQSQIRSLNYIATDLEQQQQDALQRYQGNDSNLRSMDGPKFDDVQELEGLLQQKTLSYESTIDDLGPEHRLLYQDMTLSQRDQLHKSALRANLLENQMPSYERTQQILQDLQLTNDPWSASGSDQDYTDHQRQLAAEITDALQQQMMQVNALNLSPEQHTGYQGLSSEEQLALELEAQQRLLQAQINTADERKADVENLQLQLQETLSKNTVIPNPALEEAMVDRFADNKFQVIPRVLSPKEVHYFNTLSPEHQLRLDRLSRLMGSRIREIEEDRFREARFLSHVQPTDQFYFQNLSLEQQQTVQKIVTRGWLSDIPYDEGEKEFIEKLTTTERDRIDRMMQLDQSFNVGFEPEVSDGTAMTISGQLFNERYGAPASLVLVSLVDQQVRLIAHDTTDQSGNFYFKNIMATPGLRIIPDFLGPSRETNYSIRGLSTTHYLQEIRVSVTDQVDSTAFKISNNQAQVIPDDPVAEPVDNLEYAGPVIYFDFDRSGLRPESQKNLSDLEHFLSSRREPVNLYIDGHTDNVGSRAYNHQLSLRRCLAAVEFIAGLSENIKSSTRAFGEDQPATSNRSAYGRQFNRRVEIKIQGIPYESSTHTYFVKPGISLGMIADAIGSTEAEIMEWNGLSSGSLRAYQPLRLPMGLDHRHMSHLVHDPQKALNSSIDTQYHKVQYGETLFGLAKKYATTVQALEDLNGITASDLLAGQQLRIR